MYLTCPHVCFEVDIFTLHVSINVKCANPSEYGICVSELDAGLCVLVCNLSKSLRLKAVTK